MEASIRFVCREYVNGFTGGTYELEEGATVADLVNKSLSSEGIEPKGDLFSYTMLMRNGRTILPSDRVSDGDNINVLMVLDGG